MIKKSITYENVDGVNVTEDFYFNVTKAELLELELATDEGFKAQIERITKPGAPGRDVIATFKELIKRSYGVRTPEGKFIKRDAYFEEFVSTEAYSALLWELSTDANKSAEFFNGIMPTNLVKEVEMELAKQGQQHNVFEDNVRQIQDVKVRELSLDSESNVFKGAGPHGVFLDEMSDEQLLEKLGVEPPTPEPVLTAGLSDEFIANMSGAQLAKQPREVLIRAYQLKNQQ